MADFSLLEEDEGEIVPKKYNYESDLVDGFVDSLRDEGIVSSGKLLEDQDIKAPDNVIEKDIDGFDCQYGYVFSNYVIHLSPAKNSLRVSARMAEQRNRVILAIAKTLSTAVPHDLTVNIIEPAADWDLQLWSIKIMDAKLSLMFNADEVEGLLGSLVENLKLAALGKDI